MVNSDKAHFLAKFSFGHFNIFLSFILINYGTMQKRKKSLSLLIFGVKYNLHLHANNFLQDSPKNCRYKLMLCGISYTHTPLVLSNGE